MAEIPFAFIIAGEEFDPATIDDPEQAERLEQIVDAISARVEGLSCPKHGETPRFVCSGDTLEEINLQVQGCCEELIELATQRLTPH